MCYRFNKKFGPNHRCKGKKPNILILFEEDANSKELIEEEGLSNEPETGNTTNTLMALSMHSIIVITKPRGKTMRLIGIVNGQEEALVLFDCGASHKFIDSILVEILGISIDKITPHYVTVGDGYKPTRYTGLVSVWELWWTYKSPNTTKFYLFVLGGVDMILRYEWLDSLGGTLVNWC